MTESFTGMLAGGHPNSLGRTHEVVDLVLADRARLIELFAAVHSDDEVVRMRVGDALEKVCRAQPAWLLPHVDQIFDDLGKIDQPSVQWHVAQLAQHLYGELPRSRAQRAVGILRHNLSTSSDWIVLNVTMDVLACWAEQDRQLGLAQTSARASVRRCPKVSRQTRRPALGRTHRVVSAPQPLTHRSLLGAPVRS